MKIALNPALREVGKRRARRTFAYFRPYLAKQKRLLILGFATAALQSAMMIARPWPMKVIFDHVLLSRPVPPSGLLGRAFGGLEPDRILTASILAFLGIILLEGFFASKHVVFVGYAGQRFIFSVRRRLFAHIQRLSLRFHDRKMSGELVTNLTGDINLLREMLVDSTMTIAGQSMILIGMPLVMFAVDAPLTLIALATLPALGLVSFRFSGHIRSAAKRQRIHEGRVASTASEVIHAIGVVQTFGRAGYHDELFSAQNTGSMKCGLRTKRLEANLTRLVEFIVGLGVCAVLGFGAHRAKMGLLSPGDLIVFTTYLGGFYKPLRRLSHVTARLSKAAACGERVMEVLSERDMVRSKPDAPVPDRLRGEVEFSGVTFRYDGGRPAVKSLDFRAEPGRFIGIVGPSGSGKTTVMSLLLRLYDPNRGQVRIDGRDIKDYDVDGLRERIGVILSEPILLQATVAENIAYGKPGAAMDEIETAARHANAHEFIAALPDGYRTIVSETGTTLSAGQRQRIAMARALIKGSDILLVDEPFARLDAISVEEVEKALARVRGTATIFYASHNLQEIKAADKILVLMQGKLTAQGTHEELLASCTWYRRVSKIQQGKRTPESLSGGA